MFTVKQLARIAGITPRTLHYYDEIGLLKPSRVGDNGYRYYDDGALLRLQQVLLYRKLDMPLEQIGEIMGHRDYRVLDALESHKRELGLRIRQLERLMTTVEDTILYMKGEKEMSKKQLFGGLSPEQEAAFEKEAAQKYDPATVKASNKKWKEYTPAEKQQILDEGNAVYEDLVKALPNGAASSEAQACVERWRRHLAYFWVPNLEQLLGLADLYNDDPRFKANFDGFDPRLAEFMREAVKVYVANQK
jgi:DNA-binding transcriptional MerR regulator